MQSLHFYSSCYFNHLRIKTVSNLVIYDTCWNVEIHYFAITHVGKMFNKCSQTITMSNNEYSLSFLHSKT